MLISLAAVGVTGAVVWPVLVVSDSKYLLNCCQARRLNLFFIFIVDNTEGNVLLIWLGVAIFPFNTGFKIFMYDASRYFLLSTSFSVSIIKNCKVLWPLFDI